MCGELGLVALVPLPHPCFCWVHNLALGGGHTWTGILYDAMAATPNSGMTPVVNIDAFLCDAVQSVGGKLYAIGIGWNALAAPQVPARHSRLGVGLVIRVPYTSTNQEHTFSVRVEDEDGEPRPLGEAMPGLPESSIQGGKIVQFEGKFNVGRPPTIAPGDEQIVPFALQLDGLEFPKVGVYSVVVKVDDNEVSRLPFRVTLMAQMQLGTAG